MNDFKKYSVKNLHFYVEVFPKLLKKGLLLTNQIVEHPHIVDVGCGDGRLIFALYKNGFLKAEDKIVAVDISEDRIKRLKECFSSVQAIKSDALNVKLPSASFDFVICSQLIEHVDDAQLLLEIRRLLKPKGLLFLSSVIKKRYGIYFYHKNGTFLLDPTHVKEYSSADELVDLIKQDNFGIIGTQTNLIMFPVLDIFMRVLIKCGLNFDNRFYIKHKKLSFFRKLAIPIIGYQNVDVLAQKN